MNDGIPIVLVGQPSEQSLVWIMQMMVHAGLQVVCTFDLQLARAAHAIYCPCPHHGTQTCDCQMVVLLIYGKEQSPVTLMAHSFEGNTWFSIVDTPQQRADPRLESAIRRVLKPPHTYSAAK